MVDDRRGGLVVVPGLGLKKKTLSFMLLLLLFQHVEVMAVVIGHNKVVGVVDLVVVIVIFLFVWYPFMASVYL